MAPFSSANSCVELVCCRHKSKTHCLSSPRAVLSRRTVSTDCERFSFPQTNAPRLAGTLEDVGAKRVSLASSLPDAGRP